MILEEISMKDFEQKIKKNKTVIIPVGSLEAHGPHLPLGTDTIEVYEIAKKAAKSVAVFIAPPLWYGVCRSTSKHPGTVGITPETLRRCIKDVVKSLYANRLRNFIIISGHASSLHLSALQEAGEALLEEMKAGFVAALGEPAYAEVLDAELRLGGRTISGDTHSSKFEEYRDLEPGIFGAANFLLTDSNDVTFLWGDFENIGFDDQRYSLEAGQWGRFRLFGEYTELPHVFSNDARTLYSYTGSNLLAFPDALQSAIEAVPATAPGVVPSQAQIRSALLGTGLEDADRIPLEYQLRTARAGLIFDPTEDLEFETAYPAGT